MLRRCLSVSGPQRAASSGPVSSTTCFCGPLRRTRSIRSSTCGAGLDTRPYRLRLEPSLRSFEVDQPHVLEYKASTQRYPAACSLQAVALDVTDAAATRAFFRHIGATACRALALTEGLLAYLTDEQITLLLADCHQSRYFVGRQRSHLSGRIVAHESPSGNRRQPAM